MAADRRDAASARSRVDRVDLDVLAEIVGADLPPLVTALEQLLAPPLPPAPLPAG